ncbi:MAG TPA: peptide-methionine (S)-S-oxide reductase MsrA [Burkholderiaceae bacterium]|nr:peptide-methionine (S)-S-oxide reductase MsrA [Burkholderiaceae bacterium]
MKRSIEVHTRRWLLVGLGVAAAGAAVLTAGPWAAAQAAESATRIPAPSFGTPAEPGESRTVVFAGGCFWGVQGVFQHTDGVLKAVSGYAGGRAGTARYVLVSSGMTGHAEAVQVTYDPRRISYGELLQIFFSVVHDPTQLDRQGPDVGSQYRSAVFYADATQQQQAAAYIAQLDAARAFRGRIATRLEPLNGFYPAEDDHQDYATRHPESPYIAHYDLPKIANLKALFPQRYRDEPVLVSSAKR